MGAILALWSKNFPSFVFVCMFAYGNCHGVVVFGFFCCFVVVQGWWWLIALLYEDWKDQDPDAQDQKILGEASCSMCVST